MKHRRPAYEVDLWLKKSDIGDKPKGQGQKNEFKHGNFERK
jgi:hypothetical protein